jgi:GT2 family glycosyltransferase
MNDDLSSHPLALSAPAMQFPVTVCVLAYGAHFPLAERFLTSLYQFTDPALFQLRAGLNEVEPATLELFETFRTRMGNVELFVEPRNVFKSPLMRRLIHDPPVPSHWMIWCDDDTYFTRPDWLQRFALRIETHPHVAMWGMTHALWRRDEFILEWIKAAPWYRGVDFLHGRDLDGNDAAEFRFATGGFWAIRTALLRELDWPDRRLVQANDDFLLGEALRQRRLEIGGFHYGVAINDAPRRNAGAQEVRRLMRREVP